MDKDKFTVGIISDTHGLLRPKAVNALKNSDLIIHAGDVGNISILNELRETAPVIAVRGNMDTDIWAYELNRTEIIEENKHLIYVIHDINKLDIEPANYKISIVINGHTHRPLIQKHNNVLYINPGSAGPHRPSLPVSVALLQIKGKSTDAKIIELT